MKLEPMDVTTSEDETIQFVFPDMNDTYLFSERAIITGRNEVVDDLNSKILKRMDGRELPHRGVSALPDVPWRAESPTEAELPVFGDA